MIGQIAMTSKVKHRSCVYETTDTFNVFVFIHVCLVNAEYNKQIPTKMKCIAGDAIGGKVL